MTTRHLPAVQAGGTPLALMAASVLALGGISSAAANQQPGQPTTQQGAGAESAREAIRDWPEASKKSANRMIEKYGEPDGVTEQRLLWHENDPWVRTVVYKEPVEHRFPVPHQDVLEQFIAYEVPEESFTDLAEYDGSVVAYRTNGELSARCDNEGANFLALNLAHDIIEGRRSVQDARDFYARSVQQAKQAGQGEKPEYMQSLQFQTQSASATRDPDEPLDVQVAASPQQDASGTATSARAQSIETLPTQELIGKSVVSADGETVGEVADVTREGGQQSARIELDGFFGIGESELTLPLSELSLDDQGQVQTTKSQDELESLAGRAESEAEDIL